MRASESHLVRFHGARVHALLGGPDELLREPWFGRDAIRTAATWAGIADAARAAALEALAPRALAGDDLAALAVGRIDTHAQTIDLWLAEAGRRADAHPDASMRALSVHLREAVARAAQALVDEALRAAGSRPLAPRRRPGPRRPRPAHLPAPAPARPAARARRTRGGRPVTLQREHFEARYAADPDPWDFETSAYEHDKYERTLAALGDRRYGARPSRRAARSASSPRCSPSAATTLLAVDIAQAAVDAARERLAARAHVRVERRTLPERVAGRPVRPRRLLGAPLLLGPRDARGRAARDRASRWRPAGASSPSTTARRRASIR